MKQHLAILGDSATAMMAVQGVGSIMDHSMNVIGVVTQLVIAVATLIKWFKTKKDVKELPDVTKELPEVGSPLSPI